MEALNKIEVSPKATLEEMITLITTSKGNITFSSDNLPPGGAAYKNNLYFTVTYLRKRASLALVDNDSVVNVYHWRTAKRLRGQRRTTLSTIHSLKGIRQFKEVGIGYYSHSH